MPSAPGADDGEAAGPRLAGLIDWQQVPGEGEVLEARVEPMLQDVASEPLLPGEGGRVDPPELGPVAPAERVHAAAVLLADVVGQQPVVLA